VTAGHAGVGQLGTKVGGAIQWLPIVVGDRRASCMLMPNRPVLCYQGLERDLVTEAVPCFVNDGDTDTQFEDEGERHHGTA